MMKALDRVRRCDSGAAAIEFALVSLALILVCLATIEFGRGLYTRNQLSYAADRGARMILMGRETAAEDEIRKAFTAGRADDLNVTVRADDPNFRTIEMTYPLTLFIPGVPKIELSLTRPVPLL